MKRVMIIGLMACGVVNALYGAQSNVANLSDIKDSLAYLIEKFQTMEHNQSEHREAMKEALQRAIDESSQKLDNQGDSINAIDAQQKKIDQYLVRLHNTRIMLEGETVRCDDSVEVIIDDFLQQNTLSEK